MPVAAVRIAITDDNTLLSGTGPIQGVALTPGVDIVGVFRETPSADSGIYIAQDTSTNPPNGNWTRHPDYDTEADFPADGMTFFVREGAHRRRNFQFKNEATPGTLNSTLLNFKPVDLAEAPKSTGTITVDPLEATVEQADMGVTPGTYPNLTATLTAEGNVVGAYGSGAGSTFIEGLAVVWNSTTSISVKPGAAWVEGLGRIVELASEKVFSGLNLTADTWYYLYLFEPTAGVGDVELVTTAPATPYRGKARSKSGDASRRFLRPAIRAGAAGAIRRFEVLPDGFVRWIANQEGTLRAFNATTSLTTVAEVSIGSLVPPTADAAFVVGMVANSTNVSNLYISSADDGLMTVGATSGYAGQLVSNGTGSSSVRQLVSGPVALGATKAIRHAQSAGSGISQSADILGYWEGR